MRNVFMTAFAALTIAGAASAADLSGSVKMEVTENAAGDVVNTTTLGLGLARTGVAFGNIGLEINDSSTLVVDEYALGVQVGGATVSVGDQGDLFPDGGLEMVGDDTLADPADHDSLMVTWGGASAMIGVLDMSADATDIENIQLSYGTELGAGLSVTGVVDMNETTDLNTYAAEVGADLGVASASTVITYADSHLAYELSMSAMGVTGFINGDEDDMAENIGLGYSRDVAGGLTLYAEGAYDLEAEDDKIGVGASFNF